MLSLSLIAIPTLLVSGIFAQDATECPPYSYPDVVNRLSEFPKAWDPAGPAHILSSDSAAQEKWNSIKGSVPNLPPKGGPDGDFTQFRSTYPPSDPDCWWSYKQCIGEGDVSKVPEPHSIGFGFDDGPYCAHDAFYDFLKQNNQKATMFYIGSHVLNWPLQAKRGAEDGHEICVHTWSHRHMTTLSSEDAFAELWYTMKAIELVTGVKVDCWRPPEGDVDNRIRAIAKGLGLKTILWQYDSEDWRVAAGKATREQVDANYQNFINGGKNGTFDKEGGIILQHENSNYTMSEAMKWYPAMKEAFKNVVPVGVALASNYVPPQINANESTSAGSSASASSPPPASSGFTSVSATQTGSAAGNKPTGSPVASNSTGTGSNSALTVATAPLGALLGSLVIAFGALMA